MGRRWGWRSIVTGVVIGFLWLPTRREGQWAYLVVPIDMNLFDALVVRYGYPLEGPLQGILIEHNDPSPEVEAFPVQFRQATAGGAVFCNYSEFRLVEEVELLAVEVRRLLDEDVPDRDIDEVLIGR